MNSRLTCRQAAVGSKTQADATSPSHRRAQSLVKTQAELGTQPHAPIRTYVDSSWVIRVPFLGFTFDVNDLGFIGGLGLLVVFVCYRFFLTREVDNLRLSFEEARGIGKDELKEFYKLLAMRQVFTVPLSPDIKRTKFLLLAPKLICWCPVAVYFLVIYNDAATSKIGDMLRSSRKGFLTLFEALCAVCLVILASMVTTRLKRMDEEWDNRRRPSACKSHRGATWPAPRFLDGSDAGRGS